MLLQGLIESDLGGWRVLLFDKLHVRVTPVFGTPTDFEAKAFFSPSLPFPFLRKERVSVGNLDESLERRRERSEEELLTTSSCSDGIA